MCKETWNVLSIVIPTYNEKENLPQLVDRIFSCLGSISGEIVVVDDASPDGTGQVAEALKSRYRVQVVHREGKLGLASAVVAGLNVAQGDNICVMDADLSHDPSLLPKFEQVLNSGADLVVGSRYVQDGGSEGWPKYREWGSRFAIFLARLLTSIRDATSGYFGFKRSVVEGVELDPLGFKIGLEIFVKGNFSNAVEVPFVFRDRFSGKSKLNRKEILNYFKHLMKLYKWKVSKKWIPAFAGMTSFRPASKFSSHKVNTNDDERNPKPAKQ